MKRVAMIALALASALPAMAQTVPATLAKAGAPESLAVARSVAARLLPPGVYKQVMASTMDMMAGNMGDTLKSVPLKAIAEMAGASPEDAEKFAQVDVAAVMSVYDPHWQERQERTMRAMFGAMGDFFVTMEPELREATAHAYANHFSLDELRDLNRYFATPTGAKFAGNYMTLMTDPAIAESMKAMMPKMMQQMPRFMEAAQRATADLPPPRKLEALSPAERARLAKALGVDEDKLQDPKSRI
ncbi:MAG: DUF2059 domain-containing protein [Sphingomonadales bacterium]|nr:MAG: DUF2059 domain-containing protein [Sphingomonadales bacterium]